MSLAVPMAADAVLRDQYRALDLQEQDAKREIEQAQQKLEGIRELKKRIGRNIFRSTSAALIEPPHNAATTSNHNGTT